MAIKQASRHAHVVEKEILLHRHLRHPNIVALYSTWANSTHCYSIQEWCSRGELLDHIQPYKGLPSPYLIHFYFRQLIEALCYLHERGIAHRDIKPENLLIDSSGNLKVADFGSATLFCRSQSNSNPESVRRRRLKTRCGTLRYMAPEMVQTMVNLDQGRDENGKDNQSSRDGQFYYDGEAVDWWGAGMVLWVMAKGTYPWEVADQTRCPQYAHYAATGEIISDLNEGEPLPVSSKALTSASTYKSTSRNKQLIPSDLKDLLKKLLEPRVEQRLTSWRHVIRHPWVQQSNPLINEQGQCANYKLWQQEMFGKEDDEPSVQVNGDLALTQPSLISTTAIMDPSLTTNTNTCTAKLLPSDDNDLFKKKTNIPVDTKLYRSISTWTTQPRPKVAFSQPSPRQYLSNETELNIPPHRFNLSLSLQQVLVHLRRILADYLIANQDSPLPNQVTRLVAHPSRI